MTDTLPEGTDHILPGAAKTALRDPIESFAALRERAGTKASEVKDQVSDKAMAFAATSKVRASSALDEVARMIGDTAGKIDDQIGGNYGDYARRAADAVAGASATLRDRDVEDLLEDARDVVRKSPGVAIGIAAVAGFALARILKAGGETPAASAPAPVPEPVDPAEAVSKAARKGPGKTKSKAGA